MPEKKTLHRYSEVHAERKRFQPPSKGYHLRQTFDMNKDRVRISDVCLFLIIFRSAIFLLPYTGFHLKRSEGTVGQTEQVN